MSATLTITDSQISQSPSGSFLLGVAELIQTITDATESLEDIREISVTKTLKHDSLLLPGIVICPGIEEMADIGNRLAMRFQAICTMVERRDMTPQDGMGRQLIWRQAVLELFWANSCITSYGESFNISVIPGPIFPPLGHVRSMDANTIRILGEWAATS